MVSPLFANIGSFCDNSFNSTFNVNTALADQDTHPQLLLALFIVFIDSDSNGQDSNYENSKINIF